MEGLLPSDAGEEPDHDTFGHFETESDSHGTALAQEHFSLEHSDVLLQACDPGHSSGEGHKRRVRGVEGRDLSRGK